MNCKGICKPYKTKRNYTKKDHKYCKKCRLFIKYSGINCPCCNSVLKTYPKYRARLDIWEEKFPDRAVKRL